MIDTTKKISAHFKIVIAATPALGRSDPWPLTKPTM
jgi:hypothetical protein